MKYDIFFESIQAIKKQFLIDKKCSDAFKIILPNDYVSAYDNSVVVNQLIKVLQVEMDDYNQHSIIEYFIYELDFGKKYEDGCIRCNHQIIDISNEKKLYEFLIKNKVNE